MPNAMNPKPSAPHPPPLADRLLKWFCAPHLLEEVQGDLHERFRRNAALFGERSARRQYTWEVLGFVRPFAIKRNASEYPNPFLNLDMIRNYFKVALRNLVKHKAYSTINVAGLAVGMAVALLNGLWIWDELSFNTYHQNYDRIVRVMKRGDSDGRLFTQREHTYALANELKTNYRSQFKHLVFAKRSDEYFLSAGDTKLSKTGQFIDADAPEMLTLKMLKGAWSGLQDPHSILLSASTAKALFGEKDPLNQLVKINNEMDVTVTGVYEDLPRNTDFHEVKFMAPFSLWLSRNERTKQAMNDWTNHFLLIYAQLKSPTDVEPVSASVRNAEYNKIKDLEGMPKWIARKPEIILHPMSQWHLYSNFKGWEADRGPVNYLWLIGLIGAFVLLLACINFMNLSTARSEKRAKEVGVRKAVGSLRQQLAFQFLSESFVVVLLAFGLALLLGNLLLPWFNEIAAKEISLPWTNVYFWLFSLAFIGLTGFVAGSYPAFYLSSFQPVKVLKGTFRVGRLALMPRKVLVVLQFSISVILIISTIIVYRQIQHAKNRPIGYSRDGLLMVEKKSQDYKGKYDVLRRELLNTGVVAEMAESTGPVTSVSMNNRGFSWAGKAPELDEIIGTLAVTPEYGKTVGWQFVEGRDFSRKFTSDSTGFVINEAMVRYMGIKNPVGQIVQWKWQDKPAKDFRILGVVRDMVMQSPFDPIMPTVFFLDDSPGWIHIKLNSSVSIGEALPRIGAVFKQLVPAAPFDYQFADQEYAAKFAAEERISKLATFFASLAIFISCLGLLGLAAFTAEQRTKEIGIRKVLGASVLNLWNLLSKDFVYLVAIAFVIATPVAYYFLNNWLQNYQYRTDISWWVFVLAGAIALLLTLLTVSFQSIKAALMNPVKSLRTE